MNRRGRRRLSSFEDSLQAEYTLFDSINLKEFLEAAGRLDCSQSAHDSMLGTALKISYHAETDQWTFKYSLGLGLSITFRPHIPQSHTSWYGHDVMSSFEVGDNYWLEDERCFEGPIVAKTDWRLSDSRELLVLTTRWYKISSQERSLESEEKGKTKVKKSKKNFCIRYYKRRQHLEGLPAIHRSRSPSNRLAT